MTNNIITLKDIKKTIAKTTGEQEDKIKIEELTGKTNLIFQATFTNYTPFMPGDYDTTTFKHCPPNNNEKCEINVIPLAQQIIGKMRWLLRVALASLPKCREHQTYKDIEEKCLTIEVRERNQAKDIPIMSLLFGSIGKGRESRSALYKLVVTYDPNTIKVKSWNININPANNLSQSVKEKLERIRLIRSPRRRNGVWGLPDRYSAQISRKTSPGQRSSYSVRNLRPIDAKELKIKIGIYENTSIARTIADQDYLEHLKELYGVLLIAVITILGIGKAANRGFGRFMLDEKTGKENGNNSVIDNTHSKKTSSLLKEFSKGNVDSVRKILSNIIEIIDDLSKTETPEKESETSQDVIGIIPRLDTALGYIQTEPVAYDFNEDDRIAINDVIEAIATSVVKQCRKNLEDHKIRDQPRFPPGANVHTWILGLPRQSKTNCLCSADEYQQNNRRRRTENKSMVYGYITLDRDELVSSDPVIRKLFDESNVCVPSRYCLRNSNLTTIEELLNYDLDLRRQSMVIIFPIPPAKKEHDNRPKRLHILVLPFFTRDLEFAVYPFDGRERQNLTKKYRKIGMFHVSGHSIMVWDYRNRREVRKICCNVHIQAVWKIIRSDRLSVNSDDCKYTEDAYLRCGQGSVRGNSEVNPDYSKFYMDEILKKEGIDNTRNCLIRILSRNDQR